MPAPLPSREEIVACLRGVKRSLHAGAIAKHCGVPKESYHRFAELLELLVVEGTIRSDSGRRFRALAKRRSRECWEGTLSVNPRGFGFVAASGKNDVFVAAENIGAALHGDTVAVEVIGTGPKGIEGRVARVVTRRNPRVAGVIFIKRASAWLEPDDSRVRGPIVLEDSADAADGDSGVVEITRFPEGLDENPEGRLVSVLGPPGEAATEVAKIKVREQIEEEHPTAAMLEAEQLAVRARRLSPRGRKDLRDIPLLTIDPADARDHDDAVWAERTATGYRVYVAIADVSEYVRPGTALDEEAKQRAFTIYLPDRAIPMLPGLLAADVCSLLPDRERYCMCVIAELDKDARVQKFSVHEGLMRCAAMITYGSAAKTLGYTDKPKRSPQAEAFKKDLKVLASVTGTLRRARLKRGALDLDLPEPYVQLDDDGKPEKVSRRAQDPGIKKAYQIVEELMLLANELVARWLGKRKVPAIYRVHGKPDEAKLARLAICADALGVSVDAETLLEPNGVAKWLKRIAKLEKRPVLQGLLLRSLKQAVYDIVNVGHFGLASDAYLHFTSPIRRYPDLLVHRTIKQLLRKKTLDTTDDALDELRRAATHCSTRERAAMQVEREVVDLYRALYMRDHIGELGEGKVTALVGGGVYVALAEPFVDVMIRFENLGPDRYELSEDELSLVGLRSGDRISLGDTLMLEVIEASVMRRTVYGRRVAFSSSPGFSDSAESRPAGRRRSKRVEHRSAGPSKADKLRGVSRRVSARATKEHARDDGASKGRAGAKKRRPSKRKK